MAVYSHRYPRRARSVGEYQFRSAQEYLRRGILPIKLEKNRKNPTTIDWSNPDYSQEGSLEKAFAGDVNIGLVLGKNSGGFIEVDLDCIEAVRIAPLFLPPTKTIWGRASKPRSHWGYIVDTEVRNASYNDIPNPLTTKVKPLLEIRGDGNQTMAPPSIHPDGEAVEWYAFDEPARVSIEELKKSTGYLAAAVLLARHWNGFGSRHTLAMQLAGALSRSKWTEESTDRFISSICQAALDEEEEDRRRTVRDTYLRTENDDPSTGWPTLLTTLGEEIVRKVRTWLGIHDVSKFPLNDFGNAQRFLAMHGEDIRFSAAMKIWIVWDGRQWKTDPSGTLVGNKAFGVQRAILQEATKEPDDGRAQALAKWAITSGHVSRIGSIPTISEDFSECWIDPDQLDADPYKLNVPNGVLNLITAGLEKPHNKNEYMTHMAGVSYNPSAGAPRFTYFLEETFEGNAHLIGFIKRLAGSCLTGVVHDQIFPIFFGSGANGKSTLLSILQAVWGSYCQTADPSTFLQSNNDRIRSDLARMKGSRLVTTSEVAANRKLDTAMVKAITGGDKITARFLFKDDFEYKPTYKVVMSTNYRPDIRSDDQGMWRRIRLIPFNNVVPEEKQDLALTQKIIDSELQGVLAWAVEGCIEWKKYGLGNVSEVTSATMSYKEDSDTVRLFIAEGCTIQPTDKSTSKALYSAYQTWCKSNGVRYGSSTQFKESMERLGFKIIKHGADGNWAGIAAYPSFREINLEESESPSSNPFGPG